MTQQRVAIARALANDPLVPRRKDDESGGRAYPTAEFPLEMIPNLTGCWLDIFTSAVNAGSLNKDWRAATRAQSTTRDCLIINAARPNRANRPSSF
jgi:hypothetical protein